MITTSQHKGKQCIRLLPNRSANWRQTKLFVLSLGGLSLAIATFWSLQGAWVILPFAGLEVTLLAYVVYRVCFKSYHQQVLYISEQEVLVEWGYEYPKKSLSFSREKLQVTITRPSHSLSSAKLEISEGEQNLVLGEFLNRKDTDKLITLLRESGVSHRYRGKTKTVAMDVFDEK